MAGNKAKAVNLVIQQIEIVAEKGWYGSFKTDAIYILCNVQKFRLRFCAFLKSAKS